MENKIVYLKTFIVTIAILVIIFAIAIGGCIYYYEAKLKDLDSVISLKNNLTIIQNDENGIRNIIGNDL